MSTKRSSEEKSDSPPRSKRAKQAKKQGVKYILYKERNGWEKETWLTFIPIQGNKKEIQLLLKATIVSNKQAKEWDEGRKESWDQQEERDREFYSRYGMPAPAPVRLGSTYYELNTKRVYSKEEAEGMCEEASTGYMGHLVCDDGKFCESGVEELSKMVEESDAEEIYNFLYKGGISKLL